ncbi:MAG: sel1 repeat family protein, partial [Rhodocyclaceae bacterium]|nr:sel1 repeat family protein [Rhodocyclaceae bacterium]
QAAHWYRSAANAGDPGAQYLIGHMYEIGYGVEQDTRLARHWYLQAALQGDRGAQAKYQALGDNN